MEPQSNLEVQDSQASDLTRYGWRDMFHTTLYTEGRHVSMRMVISEAWMNDECKLACLHLRKFKHGRPTKEGVSFNHDQATFLMKIFPEMVNFEKNSAVWSDDVLRIYVCEDLLNNSLIRFRKEKYNIPVQQIIFKREYLPRLIDNLQLSMHMMECNSGRCSLHGNE